MSRLCRDSQWPLSGSIPVGIPTEFHLNRYCRWLLSAGADPRLSIVLCAGAGAKQSFIDGVRARKIIPELAPARSQRPVAENLSKHQGTHFNSTLFIVDGLESLTRDAFSTLNGQRGLLNRMATWVAIVVEDMETLCRLYQMSGDLMRDAERRLLVVSADLPDAPQATAPVGQLNGWRRSARVAELAFHTVMTQAQIADYDDVSRLLRSGYGEALSPLDSATWTPWQRVWHGAEPQVVLNRDLASAVARHLPGNAMVSDVIDRLEHRPICMSHVSQPSSHLASLLSSVPETDVGSWAHEIRTVTQMWSGRDAERAVTELVIAEGYAAHEDVDGCLAALPQGLAYAEHPSCPEVFFELGALMLKLRLLMGERKASLLVLNALEQRIPDLHSPFMMAVSISHVGTIGPPWIRCQLQEYESALRLFSMHGYPSWAETADGRIQALS